MLIQEHVRVLTLGSILALDAQLHEGSQKLRTPSYSSPRPAYVYVHILSMELSNQTCIRSAYFSTFLEF